jgi:hypothetical protein
MDSKVKSGILSLLLLAVAVTAALPVVDEGAQDRYQDMFQRALVSFALARTLNGVISTIQGTELAVQPAGVGVTLTPGEILDPVNDLVERFSWVMLASSVSLGMQQVLLEVSRWWPVKVAAVLFCALALFFVWRSDNAVLRRWLSHFLVVVLFVRFAAPVMLIFNDTLYEVFLDPRYQESAQMVSATGAELEKLGASDPISDADSERGEAGFFGSISRVMNGATEALDFRARVERISEYTGKMIEHLIQLCVVFLIQTVFLPLGFLWFLLAWARWFPKKILQSIENRA